jgi:dipeptidyl aminopeptidase/acylaminoacyl peptidase
MMPLSRAVRPDVLAVVLSSIAIFAGASCRQPPAEPAQATPAVRPSAQASPATQAAQPAEAIPPPSKSDKLEPTDLYHLRSVGEVRVSPDGSRIVYAVINSDRPGRPYSQIWVLDVASRQVTRLGAPDGTASSPRWSPDGRAIAYLGTSGERRGLMIADAKGAQPRFVAAVEETNHPLPTSGDSIAWSPDGTQIAFVSATPGPETDANGDPMVITRYLYKPTASEGLTRFNDNRRLHIFVADVRSGGVRQLTNGTFHEHSLDWSPAGDRILFVSNHERDPDRFFNYDLFTVRVADGTIAPLTATKNAEYQPSWSPDGRRIAYLGTTRPLTSSETTMEDTHVWVMNADGSDRHQVRGTPDNRQGAPQWSADGQTLYFAVQERGDVRLYQVPAAGGRAERALAEEGSIGAWSVAAEKDPRRDLTNGVNPPRRLFVAYAQTTATRPAELFLRTGEAAAVRLTDLNEALLANKKLGSVDRFTFRTADGMDVEAFLTSPADRAATDTVKRPLIVMIHGGPHGQQGPAFNSKSQIYAAHGWATLMVNYRGSTGYGQKFADAIFGDQNGAEAKDVLAGVSAAAERYPWLDATRMGIEGGSYGGQLTNWIVTQTDQFRAAVPLAGISNLVTQNYLSYYHDYLAVEYGAFPHEKGIIDKLWERSAIRYANRVRTPTMFVHGEHDNDVPIEEAEQFYIALKDVGVETIMIRYPREGHGVRETKHSIDLVQRSIEWYERHFTAQNGAGTR